MTNPQKTGLKIGTAVALLAILGAILGWISGSFAQGTQYGELRSRVHTNERDILGLGSDIHLLRVEIRSGFDRLADKLDERTILRPTGANQ